MDKKNKIWIGILLTVCLVCVLSFYLVSQLSTGTVAVVRLDGEEIARIDLSKVSEAYEIPVESEYGFNRILVSPGGIAVIEADCPDGVCVRQGEIHQGGVPILCMPHRLSITIEGSGIDA